MPGGLSDDDTVLIVGAGLTMIDVALLLEAKGFKGSIVAMSRRGPASAPARGRGDELAQDRRATEAAGLGAAA